MPRIPYPDPAILTPMQQRWFNARGQDRGLRAGPRRAGVSNMGR